MPVNPTYPGVYVQEIPSGVRTIAGVSTSIALFIGRAKMGPLNAPQLILNYSDFERVFTAEEAGSELAHAVRLFFQNGGTQCYVIRIAKDAVASAVTLKNEASTEVLTVSAKSPGVSGDNIRLAVTYRGYDPESTFDLEVFQYARNIQGDLFKSNVELYGSLTMDRHKGRYAVDQVNQNSKLIEMVNIIDPSLEQNLIGYSQSGRPVPGSTDVEFRNQWKTLIGKHSADGANQFRISVDGNAFVTVDLSTIDFAVAPLDSDSGARATLAGVIKERVEDALPAGAVDVTMIDDSGVDPDDKAPAGTVLLRITSNNGDVKIEPAADHDLAIALMLGTAQGGLEVSRYASLRPAPTGSVFDIDHLAEFAGLVQSAFDTLTVGGKPVALNSSLITTTASDHMYQDKTGHNDGVREKLNLIAAAVNTARANDPSFTWSAEVWGQRLALIPAAGADNLETTVATGDGDDENIGTNFLANVRYYSLGTTGRGSYQSSGVAGSDGSAPELKDYDAAYQFADREIDLFNLLILPKDSGHNDATTNSLWGQASGFCQKRRAFLLMDAPVWPDVQAATDPMNGVNGLRIGLVKDYSAIFYPRLVVKQNGSDVKVGPSGAIAGLMARVDANRGVWKAPAGTEADLRGIVGVEQRFSDGENGVLNPNAVNTIRVFPAGIVNWGARTMFGYNNSGSEYSYIPVRRLALFLEESLYRGLQWVVFEPNDEPLWSQIRLNVGAFMHGLFRQGAFQGKTPSQAYFVKCDSETTTQNDINLGIVNIIVGFAPLKPAEFVILSLQQIAGQIET